VIIGHVRKSESVLIHTGSGGVGQAAINICLNAGCTVYTTVGTKEKRDFMKTQFPQVFGYTFNKSFELPVSRPIRRTFPPKSVI
jgi:fatty acid synthase